MRDNLAGKNKYLRPFLYFSMLPSLPKGNWDELVLEQNLFRYYVKGPKSFYSYSFSQNTVNSNSAEATTRF